MAKGIITPFWKQAFVSAAVFTDVIGHGCILGFPAVLLPHLRSKESTIPCSEEDASWIASILGIAMLFGLMITPPIMGRLGRKIAHYTVILEALVAWLMITLASSIKELIIARFLLGLSYGMFTPLRSILIGEYTSPKYRAAFLATLSLAQGFGIMLAHLLGSFMHWQWTALVCVVITFASLLMTLYAPESPSWLADRGRYDECRKVFHWLRGFEEDKELEEMIEARKFSNNLEKENNFKSVLKVLNKKEFYKPVIVTIHAYAMLSFSGAMTLASFAVPILTAILGPDANVHVWMVALDTQRIFTNSIAIFVFNKIKRRTMTFVTLIMCIFAHFSISAYVYARELGVLYYTASWIPGIFVFLQYLSIATGMVALPGVIVGEIFPLAYRSIGGSVSIAFYAGSMFLVLKTYHKLMDNLGLHGTYIVYGGILTYCLVVIWFLLPETHGKTLQQIEDGYRDAPKATEGEVRPLALEMTDINCKR